MASGTQKTAELYPLGVELAVMKGLGLQDSLHIVLPISEVRIHTVCDRVIFILAVSCSSFGQA